MARSRTDSRIESIPCDERQWTKDAATPIIGITLAPSSALITTHRQLPNVELDLYKHCMYIESGL